MAVDFKNPRKGMNCFNVWLTKEEEIVLLRLLRKEVISQEDMGTIVSILSKVDSRGDLYE